MNAILAIETSSGPCSVALDVDGAVERVHVQAPRAHARALLPAIADLLANRHIGPGDLQAIVYGQGPGSFTGLRIGCAVAQGLSWAHDLPTFGVSSLEVLAERVRAEAADTPAGVITVVDARMDEVYLAAFELVDRELVRVLDDQVCASASAPSALQSVLPESFTDWLAVGDGVDLVWPERTDVRRSEIREPEATALLRCARGRFAIGAGDARAVQPVYLRDERRWRKQTLAGP